MFNKSFTLFLLHILILTSTYSSALSPTEEYLEAHSLSEFAFP